MIYKTELMSGKTFLIMGVANERSIAWSVLNSLKQHGASEFILTYKNDKGKARITRLTKGMNNISLVKCDVSSDKDLENLSNFIKNKYKKINGVVHSIAYANSEDLRGNYFEVSRANFMMAQDISAYSLVAVVRHLYSVIKDGGSIVTMTYIGSE